jgi:molybdopterin-guanine dinucleotide biosynthesis protein A
MTNTSTNITLSGVNGLILTGGKSSRMGRDKGLLQYHGVAQREYLFSMLGKFCSAVFTSCKDLNSVPANLNPIADKFPFEGPLNGILTAFFHDANAAWITVPVDMPLINEKVIGYLLKNRDPRKIATSFFDSEGKNPEPLVTVWEKHAYHPLLAFYKEGNKSPREFLKRERSNVIEIPDAKALLNINTLEELEKFKSES